MFKRDRKSNKKELNIASFFSGCGGLDLGFEEAGFRIAWANEFDKTIWKTFQANFPFTELDTRSITEVEVDDIKHDIQGIIGGPPCQAWSEAGAGRGFKDVRGQVFLDYIRIIKGKQPLFFLAENVSGMLFNRHSNSFNHIVENFKEIGYNVNFKLLNAKNYNVPQDRERVIIVGYHKNIGKFFEFPEPSYKLLTLRDAIGDLPVPKPAAPFNKTNGNSLKIANHEYMTGSYSSIYMSRNRVRSWDEQSFTIQAGGRHAPIHPQAPKMKFISQNHRVFVPGKEELYRRLSVRECARIQTFPDTFILHYHDIADGYKMIGNAVPVKFAKALAVKIKEDIDNYLENNTYSNSASVDSELNLVSENNYSLKKSKKRKPCLKKAKVPKRKT